MPEGSNTCGTTGVFHQQQKRHEHDFTRDSITSNNTGQRSRMNGNSGPYREENLRWPGQGEAAFAPGPEQRSAPHDDLSAEIAAEIADHLAEAAALARTQGHTDEEAHALAANRFGDAAAILRQCWWIKKGDTIMFRSAAIALLSICVIGLFAVAYSAWRIEASFSERMNSLSGELESLNSTQQQLLANLQPAAAAPAKQQITGKLYLGDPSVPAVNAELEIWNTKTMEMVRQLRTDSSGAYDVRDLADGEYFVLASLVGPGNSLIPYPANSRSPQEVRKRFCVQSAPLTVWPDGGLLTCDLDVQLQTGRIRFEFNREVPPVIFEQAPKLLLVNFSITSLGYKTLPLPQIQPLPDRSATFMGGPWAPSRDAIVVSATWPQRGTLARSFGQVLPGKQLLDPAAEVRNGLPWEGSRAFEICTAYEFGISDEEPFVPTGKYDTQALIGPAFFSGSFSNETPFQETLHQMQFDGRSWDRGMEPFLGDPLTFEVRPNHVTRLRVVVPDDYVATVEAALAKSQDDVEGFARACSLKPLAIELIGYEPLDEAK